LRKVAVFVVVALAAIGVAFAVVPFRPSEFSDGVWKSVIVGHCSAPIVSAFRAPHDGGWFGYAPLTDTPIENGLKLPTCKTEGQRRLEYAGMFVLAAAVIAITLRRNRSEASGTQPDAVGGSA
jgi:hypothetical protein